MDGDLWIQFIIILVLIILNGVFSMTEIAIVNARKGLLEERAENGDKGAKKAMELAEDPSRMFSIIQIGITLISIVTGLYSGATFSMPLDRFLKANVPWLAPYADVISPIIIVAFITYLSLVIGELVPKRLAYNAPEKIATAISVPMYYFSVIASPVIKLLSLSTNVLIHLLGVREKAEEPVTESEINKMLTQGVELGAYTEEEPKLVDNIFRLGDLSAEDVMTPRTQLTWIDLNGDDSEIEEVLCHSQHYRVPVAEDSLDDLLGLVTIADVFAEQVKTKGKLPFRTLVRHCIKQPLMVPESISLMKVLSLFRSEGVHETVVLDEYGGFSGLVTLRDIMEEIVGLLPSGEEELKEEERRIVKRSAHSWLVDGMLGIDEFKEYFEIDKAMPGEDDDLYKTLAGFLMYRFGHIPHETEKCLWDAYTFEVIDMDNVRIDKVLVTRDPKVPSSTPGVMDTELSGDAGDM